MPAFSPAHIAPTQNIAAVIGSKLFPVVGVASGVILSDDLEHQEPICEPRFLFSSLDSSRCLTDETLQEEFGRVERIVCLDEHQWQLLWNQLDSHPFLVDQLTKQKFYV